MKKFTVITSNKNQTGGFVWKLQTTQEATVFGIKKTVNRTYYIGGMPSEAKVGDIFEENLNRFDIVERPFLLDEQTGETIMLKWLHVKVS